MTVDAEFKTASCLSPDPCVGICDWQDVFRA
jgi:hypothetical protein